MLSVGFSNRVIFDLGQSSNLAGRQADRVEGNKERNAEQQSKAASSQAWIRRVDEQVRMKKQLYFDKQHVPFLCSIPNWDSSS